MKMFLVLVAVAVSCVLGAQDSYTDKYDGMDIEQVLANRRLLQAYTRCMLDQGKCTPEGRELKSHISEALQNGCNKCTGSQRQAMRKVIKHFIDNDNDTWQQMVDKYDPKRIYTNKYEKELKKLYKN